MDRSKTESILPGVEVDFGDCDGITGDKGITEKHQLNKWDKIDRIDRKTHIRDGFLKANGCISLMSSPLSQCTRARLDFLTSSNCSLVNFPGLTMLS